MKGAGLGFGYSVVLAVATTWFPARRGLVVGMIVGGFGLGALIFTPIQTAYINPDNIKVNNITRQMTDEAVLNRVPSAFLMLGGILLSLQVIGFILLRPKPVSTTEPEDNKVEAGKKKDMGDLDDAPGLESEGMLEENLQPKQVIRRLDFYLLWLVMFCNIIPITIITSIYKYFGQEYISDDFFLSSVATTSALFNCGGRIMWGAIVDKISFKIPLCVMLFLWSLILITFPHLSYFDGVLLKSLYTIWVCLLFLSLSGVFVMMPAATGILFGPANLAVNYGLVFNAFVSTGVIIIMVVCGLRYCQDAQT
ncbi:hypothetical protein AHF37_08561 [Paragonimus kellicotti]|nr:hypothetical protein AHF37_08561 [Paragonimus kellicotti]